MGRASFVAWLFISAIACVVIAAVDHSWGWFIGGVVISSVAMFARHQFKRELDVGRATASGRFVGLAILAMLSAMFFLFWLQTSA